MCKDHKQLKTCNCGKNTYCSNCGIGTGYIPCDCSPKIEYWILTLTKEEQDEWDIWEVASMQDFLKLEEQE